MWIKVVYVESRSLVSDKGIEHLRISNRNFPFVPSTVLGSCTEVSFHIVGKAAQPVALEVASTARAWKEHKWQQ